MKQLDLGKIGLWGSEISLGCMRMRDLSVEDAAIVLRTSLDSGINFFDHADIYGEHGLAEEIFGKAVKALGVKREDMKLQTKCGIQKSPDQKRGLGFNFSKAYIISCVEGSLKRLQVDYVDLLALHRPDTLMEPEEVAATFDILYRSGKVRHFGVSNQPPGQMALLQKYTDHKLIVNQLQFSLVHTGMIDAGFHANMKTSHSVDHDGGILEYCRLHDVTIQAWSPFRPAVHGGVFIDNPEYIELNAKLAELAEQYRVTKDAIAAAWILRHPAKMQVIIGSMNPGRIEKISEAASISLSHEEWYALYLAAGNMLP
ncbi:MAG: aldo/keto reductase [Oscillospiraceae bacterium]|nr:aldo/keto reductase [Oscillospiraceae bacterium]